MNVLHTFAPRGGATEMMQARESEVLISGPAGTGKSRACLEKLHMMCLMTPGLRAGIFRKTLSSLGSTALVTWRRFVIAEALAVGDVTYFGGSAQEAPQYRYSNGSTVTIGGMNHPDRIMSSEYDIVYVQEATELTIDDLEAIVTRLRNWRISFQQLLMDCNPAGDKHWLLLRCFGGATRLIESRHEDNPVLFDEVVTTEGVTYTVTERGADYIAKLDRLTGVRKQRLRYGKWVSAEGAIYEEFDPAYHILEWSYDEEGNRLPLPPEWERFWVIDFGIVHPFVCKWYARDEDGILYMYREWYMTDRTVQEHAEVIMGLVTKKETLTWYDHFNKVERSREVTVWTEPEPTAIICDHDAEGRRTFEKATGLGTVAATKNVFDGIDLTKERWKLNQFGEARLYYMRDALVEKDENRVSLMRPTCSQEEIGGYVWKKDTQGKIKQEPVKIDDDGMDCDRYMVMYLDYKGAPRLTEINY